MRSLPEATISVDENSVTAACLRMIVFSLLVAGFTTGLPCRQVHAGQADPAEAGRRLFRSSGCYACHITEGIEGQRKFAPPLNGLRAKLADKRSGRTISYVISRYP